VKFFKKRVIDPVKLDSALFLLSTKIPQHERTVSANRLAVICLVTLTRIKRETTELQFFIEFYKFEKEISEEKYKSGEISLSEVALKKVVVKFLHLYQFANKDREATLNLKKIIKFIHNFSNNDLGKKISAQLKFE